MTVDVEQDIDLSALEESLNADHCELKHNVPGWPMECSHTPVAIWKDCAKVRKICLKAALAHARKPLEGMLCKDCRRPAIECWIVTPI
jgi:hypothetical protein